jgi:2-amino-4-hydroxy-6-hydroxymethyldihydropteridine diphosphokinase
VTTAYIGLGTNLGDRTALLHSAIEALDWGDVRVVKGSRVYETEPVGGPAGQPLFLNQVVEVETSLGPDALWDRCSGVEAALGRSRARELHWGPRAIDLDILLFGDLVNDDPMLQIPHPRLHERAFVLVPLAEIAPEVKVPGHGSARDLAEAIDRRGVWVFSA